MTMYSFYYRECFLILWCLLFQVFGFNSYQPRQRTAYAVVIGKEAYTDAGWKAVADSLVQKHKEHNSKLFVWTSTLTDIKDALAVFAPTHIGFVARPAKDCNAAFVVAVSRLARELDTDPYGDAYWGIITGYESSDALRAISESLIIRTVINGSGDIPYEPPLRRYYQALGMPCDSYTRTDYLFINSPGTVYTASQRPDGEGDRIKLIAKWLNASSLNIPVAGQQTITGTFDCLLTGGHGFTNTWQCHYPDAGTEGNLKSYAGQLTSVPYSGSTIDIQAATPKVYWAICNCLMGNPDNSGNMVYAMFHTGHAVQMFGFVNSASAGDEFMAWGTYDRLTKNAGSYTLPQSFFLANNNAMFELKHPTGQFTASSIQTYMDSTAFYGDPLGNVYFHDSGDSAKMFMEKFSSTGADHSLTNFEYAITASAQGFSFDKGYCYQFRPAFVLPVRIDPTTVTITGNDGHTADITDNLLLWEILAKGESMAKGATKTLQWTAKTIDITSLNPQKKLTDPHAIPAITADGNRIRILCTGLADGHALLSIHTLNGKTLIQKEIFITEKKNMNITLPSRAASGILIVKIAREGEIVLKKVITAGEK